MSVPLADSKPRLRRRRADRNAPLGRARMPVQLLGHDHRDIPFAASFPEITYLFDDDVYEYLSLCARHGSASPTVFTRRCRVSPSARRWTRSPMTSAELDDVDDRHGGVEDRLRPGPATSSTRSSTVSAGSTNSKCLRQGASGRWEELLETKAAALGKFAGLVRRPAGLRRRGRARRRLAGDARYRRGRQNHNGDVATAKSLADVAPAAGADSVKFRVINPRGSTCRRSRPPRATSTTK